MGASKSKNKEEQQKQGSYQVEHYYDEVIEYEQCCGFQRKKTVKKELIWEDNFKRNCQDLLMYYEWIHDLQETVKSYGRKLPRKKFLDEVNALRVINKVEAPKENQILLSPSQIDQFKVNLKNSVLLSYGQALKPSRPKQTTKIESIIYSTATKPQKNLNMSSSFNNPPSLRKKSDFSHDQRKDSILKERQKTLRQSYSKGGLRESIMSFVDDTMSTLFRGHEKQISKQSAHCLQVFLKFSLILEKHLTNKENIICIIIDSFTSYIYKKYSIFESSQSNKGQNQLSQMSEREKQILYLDDIQQRVKKNIKKQRFKQLQKRKSLTTEEVEDLTTDIKIFLVLLRQIIQDYYKTNQFSYEFVSQSECGSQQTERSMTENFNINTLITNEDNILILVTAILFKNEKFYNHIMSIFKKFHYERESNFRCIIEGLKDRPPEYFEIKADYCLNDQTIQKFKGNLDKNVNILSELESKVQQKPRSNSKQQNLSQKKQSQKQMKDSRYKNVSVAKPYQKCAEILQKITKSKTASSKMKVIMECSQKITESVAEFYNSNLIELKNHVLDADQILSIFCYILATNSLENIHANLFMIQHFATENQMISVTGYYYSVLTIAVEQLENMYSSTVADMESILQSEHSAKEPSLKGKKVAKTPAKSALKQGNKDKSQTKKSFKKVE